MLTKRRRQRKQQKKTIGLISKSNQPCTCNTLFCTFLCRCFARRQRETSRNFLVARFMEEMLYVVLFTFFSLPLFFTLVAASISHCFSFSHSRYKIFMLFFKRYWTPLFFTSGSSSFSVIHANVDFKIKSKEGIGFIVAIFLPLKVRVAVRFTAETRVYLKCKISPRLTWRGWRTYGHTDVLRTDDFLGTKIS